MTNNKCSVYATCFKSRAFLSTSYDHIFDKTLNKCHDHIILVCPSHKYGPHCRHYCKCHNEAKCDSKEGTCSCTKGWSGTYCNISCTDLPGKTFGENCSKNCTCESNNVEGRCDIKTGKCFCKPGYTRDKYVDATELYDTWMADLSTSSNYTTLEFCIL